MSSNLAAQRQVGRGLVVLRAVVGFVFLMHGLQKVFVLGPGRVSGAFLHMGVPVPAVTSVVVMVVEIIGGTALILGVLTRVAAGLLAIEMVGAIVLVRAKGGFFLPAGTEYELVLLAAAVTLVLAGPGALALGSRLGRSRGGPRI